MLLIVLTIVSYLLKITSSQRKKHLRSMTTKRFGTFKSPEFRNNAFIILTLLNALCSQWLFNYFQFIFQPLSEVCVWVFFLGAMAGERKVWLFLCQLQ